MKRIARDILVSPGFRTFARFQRFRQFRKFALMAKPSFASFGSFAKDIVSVSPETLVLTISGSLRLYNQNFCTQILKNQKSIEQITWYQYPFFCARISLNGFHTQNINNVKPI